MKKIHLSEEDLKEIFSVSKSFVETDSTGYKRIANYNYKDMNIGMAGERAFEKFSGYKWNKDASSYCGPKADFFDEHGHGIQVKTCSYGGPGPKELKLKAKETFNISNPKNNIKKLVLCYYNKERDPNYCYIIGEISTESFIRKKRDKVYGNNVLHIVEEHNLDKIYK